MKVLSSLSDAAQCGPTVLSIGNFDGLHLGHRSILETVLQRAQKLGVLSAVMTFDPHPVRVLAPERAPKLIRTLDQRLRAIEEMGIALTFVARFDTTFARLSPEEFVRRYIVDGLHARAVCVGSNFNFGYRQSGTVETLREWRDHFEVVEVPPVRVRGVLASSTHIRRLVAAGRVSRACRLLGHWFELEGPIVAGAGRGRRETVPTLNVEPENELQPERGVYITQIALDGGPWLDAVTNIGVRPTFGENTPAIETFVLKETVPDRTTRARIRFLRRLREERRFNSPPELKQQITRDVDRALKFFRIMHHATTHSH